MKTVFIVALLIIVIMIPVFSYWVYNVPYQNGSSTINPNYDPYNQIWNGTIYKTPSAIFPVVQSAGAVLLCSNPCVSTPFSTTKGYSLLVSASVIAGCSTPTDTQSNTFVSIVQTNNGFNYGQVWGVTSLASTGSDTVTVTGCGTTGYGITFTVISGVGSFGVTASHEGNGQGTPFTNSLSLTTSAGSLVYEQAGAIDLGGSGCPTPTVQNSQTIQNSSCWTTGGLGEHVGVYSKNAIAGANSYGLTWSGLGGASINYEHIVIEVKTVVSNLPCPEGYLCSNSYTTANDIELSANSTNPGVMLTQSAPDLSLLASKQSLFYETYKNQSNLNKPIAWFLTTNATLPSQAGYSPLADTSVAMVYIYYGSTNHPYLFIQRQPGQQLLAASGLPEDSFSDCPQSSTLYLCQGSTNLSNAWTTMVASLNFSGPIPGAANGSGLSFICQNNNPTSASNFFNQGTAFCIGPKTTATLPWLNVQTKYYIGFWSAAGQNGVVDFGSTDSSATFSERANAIFYWVPNTCANGGLNCVQSTTDTGGFVGWLGRTLGGAVNTVVKTIQNAGSWVQNTALGPIGDVIQGTVSWMINQIVNFLNWVGSGFGFPNLGSSLLSAFSDLVTTVTKTIVDFGSWVTQTGSQIVNALVFVENIFANAVIFGLLAFVVGPALTLLNIILLMITLFFAFTTPASYLLMMDWVWGALMVYVIGVSGFLWWTDLNVQIFTFVFKAIWKFTELVWRVIVIIKSFIPTEGGTPADLKDPMPGSGPKGGSGSGGKPESKKEEIKGEKSGGFKMPSRGYGQGAKDGDPFAILILAFMIMVLLYWLSQAAFSPLATQTVVGCTAWSTNCHVQNGVMVGSIDTTTFFAYMFSTGHGVRIIFTLLVPMVVIMFAYWFMRNVVGEDKARGNDFLNIGGTVARTAERTATSRRETMRRFRKENEK